MKNWEILYLSQDDCVKATGTVMHLTMQAVERSFFLHGKGDYIQPGKPVIRWGDAATEETIGRVMSMPSYLGGNNYKQELADKNLLGPVNRAGIKYIPSRPSNPSKHGLPRATGLIIILDEETLIPLCVMDAAIVSAMRTGAATGVAAKYLARKNSKTLGLIGASVQAKTQLAAIKAAIPNVTTYKVFDINKNTAISFAKEFSAKLNIDIQATDSAKQAVTDSDIVITATMAKAPYMDAAWYKPGVFHSEISFWDTPPQALTAFDKIYVDDWYQVTHHGVDVSHRAVQEGYIKQSAITGELGKVVTSALSGRENDNENIFFNPIGLGIHDLSEGDRVYEAALKAGIGKKLNYFKQADSWLQHIQV